MRKARNSSHSAKRTSEWCPCFIPVLLLPIFRLPAHCLHPGSIIVCKVTHSFTRMRAMFSQLELCDFGSCLTFLIEVCLRLDVKVWLSHWCLCLDKIAKLLFAQVFEGAGSFHINGHIPCHDPVIMPKWPQMVDITCFDNLWPFLAYLLHPFGPFSDKTCLLPQTHEMHIG